MFADLELPGNALPPTNMTSVHLRIGERGAGPVRLFWVDLIGTLNEKGCP